MGLLPGHRSRTGGGVAMRRYRAFAMLVVLISTTALLASMLRGEFWQTWPALCLLLIGCALMGD